MSSDVKAAFRREMAEANSAEPEGNLALAKRHLERAHILGQRWFLVHMESQLHLLRIAMREADSKEARPDRAPYRCDAIPHRRLAAGRKHGWGRCLADSADADPKRP